MYILLYLYPFVYIWLMAKTKQINRIKEVLKEKGISQQWLANEAKITYASINMYVNGKREPSLETLVSIAKALKVNPKDLINN